MPSLAAARDLNRSFKPTYKPVVVITGATSGIGESVTQLFASILAANPHATGAHFILVARNKTAADRIIAGLPQGLEFTYEFIKCDLTLMRSIVGLADLLKSKVDKINFLVHSAGLSSISNVVDLTEEGIHRILASRYYSRFALTNGVVSLLEAAKERGEKASVLSILGAGTWRWVDLDNLGMTKGPYKGWRAMAWTPAYNDLMVAEFGKRYPSLAFTHTATGMVTTPGHYAAFPSRFGQFMLFILAPLVYLMSTSGPDNAEFMLYGLLSADKGMYRKNARGEDMGVKALPVGAAGRDAPKELFEHSAQVVEAAVKS